MTETAAPGFVPSDDSGSKADTPINKRRKNMDYEQLTEKHQKAKNDISRLQSRLEEITQSIRKIETEVPGKAANGFVDGDLSEGINLLDQIATLRNEQTLLEAAMPELERKRREIRDSLNRILPDSAPIQMREARRQIIDLQDRIKRGALTTQEELDRDFPDLLEQSALLHEADSVRGYLRTYGFRI
jgi:hypothetical protein